MEKTYGYARVSTKEQSLERQLIELRKYVEDERDIITDMESGKDFQRTGYQYLRERLLRPGDTLIVKSLDRLARNKEATLKELMHYKEVGVHVRILDLPTTMVELPKEQAWVFELVNDILIQVLASIAEQERIIMLKRQAEGIAAARAQGKHLGRPRAQYPDNWEQVYTDWQAGKMTAVKAMDMLGLKKVTFYKLARQWRAKHGATQR